MLSDIISWFKANFLSLAFNKSCYLEFRTKNCIDTTLGIKNVNKNIVNIIYTNFLCLLTDDTMNLDNHIDQLISIFKSTYYAITAVKAMLSMKPFTTLYFPYVHSAISHCTVFAVTLLIVLKYSECENKY
jgi:hypothetical protein